MRYSLAKAPKLVDIIAAVPEEHKATLLPQWVPCLRSWFCCPDASLTLGGLRCAWSSLRWLCLLRRDVSALNHPRRAYLGLLVWASAISGFDLQTHALTGPMQASGKASAHSIRHCSGGCDEQTPPLPPHRYHRQHLRVLPWRP